MEKLFRGSAAADDGGKELRFVMSGAVQRSSRAARPSAAVRSPVHIVDAPAMPVPGNLQSSSARLSAARSSVLHLKAPPVLPRATVTACARRCSLRRAGLPRNRRGHGESGGVRAKARGESLEVERLVVDVLRAPPIQAGRVGSPSFCAAIFSAVPTKLGAARLGCRRHGKQQRISPGVPYFSPSLPAPQARSAPPRPRRLLRPPAVRRCDRRPS